MLCGILFQILCLTFQYHDSRPRILRSFIAIELPEEVKSALSRLQDKLKESVADIRWVKPDNIHLTLKFLGDIDDKNIGNIVQQLEGACAEYSFFDLEVSGIGVFPNDGGIAAIAGTRQADRLACVYRDTGAFRQ